MARQTLTESKPMHALRRVALQYPEAQEGVVCTKRAFKARNKAFLFMGMDDRCYDAMLKLRESLAEAAKLATKEPDCYTIGAHGWVTATFSHGQSPPPGLLEGWIDESYRLLVHKQLVAMLPDRGLPTVGSTQAAKKRTPKKKATPR